MTLGLGLRCLVALSAFAVLVATGGVPQAAAQAAGHTVNGRVTIERGSAPNTRVEVLLVPSNGAGHIDTYTDLSGRFTFKSIRPGVYTVTVRAPLGAHYGDGTARVTIYDSTITTSYFVDVTLPVLAKETTPAPRPGTVSVDDFQPDVPDEARRLHEKSTEAAGEGRLAEAVGKCREALEIAPTFRAALNDLGVYLMRLGRTTESVPHLRRAVELGPESFGPNLNLAIALFEVGDLEEAATRASRAIEIDPVASRAWYVAGQIALKRDRVDDARHCFERAEAMGGDAKLAAVFALAELYDRAGATEKAIATYQRFLALEAAGRRADQARQRLRALGAQP